MEAILTPETRSTVALLGALFTQKMRHPRTAHGKTAVSTSWIVFGRSHVKIIQLDAFSILRITQNSRLQEIWKPYRLRLNFAMLLLLTSNLSVIRFQGDQNGIESAFIIRPAWLWQA